MHLAFQSVLWAGAVALLSRIPVSREREKANIKPNSLGSKGGYICSGAHTRASLKLVDDSARTTIAWSLPPFSSIVSLFLCSKEIKNDIPE